MMIDWISMIYCFIIFVLFEYSDLCELAIYLCYWLKIVSTT